MNSPRTGSDSEWRGTPGCPSLILEGSIIRVGCVCDQLTAARWRRPGRPLAPMATTANPSKPGHRRRHRADGDDPSTAQSSSVSTTQSAQISPIRTMPAVSNTNCFGCTGRSVMRRWWVCGSVAARAAMSATTSTEFTRSWSVGGCWLMNHGSSGSPRSARRLGDRRPDGRRRGSALILASEEIQVVRMIEPFPSGDDSGAVTDRIPLSF